MRRLEELSVLRIDEMARLPDKYPANKEDRRCLNFHDVDEVGRWTVTRWISGGSTGVRQGGQHDAMVRKVKRRRRNKKSK